MQTRKLGTLTVSPVGLGCMGMSHAYGSPLSPSEVKKVITEAFDIGYTFLIPLKYMAPRYSLTIMKKCWAMHSIHLEKRLS